MLRPAAPRDWARILAWRNDPDAMEQSLVQGPVALKDHILWWRQIMSPNCPTRLWIGHDAARGVDMGMIRLDIVNRDGTISIVVDKNQRGRGYGSEMLSALLYEARAVRPPLENLIANVKSGNLASLRLFVSHGFELDFGGCEREVLVLRRPMYETARSAAQVIPPAAG